MPEAYTHVRIARAALRAARLRAEDTAALITGASGPDPLFVDNMPRLHGPWPMQELGVRIHREQCGVFLQALVYYARTPAQKSYALGFLAHNAADALLHPYVTACAAEGGPFAGREGHARCEVALDTYFHLADGGKAAVPADEVAPALKPFQTAELCALLRRAINAVYGVKLSALELSDMLDAFRLTHCYCGGAGPVRRAAGAAVSRVFVRRPGYAAAHMTPARQPEAGFPTVWVHPATKEEIHAGPNALALAAARRAAVSMEAAARYWSGGCLLSEAARAFGNWSYETGLSAQSKAAPKPVEPSAPLQPPGAGCAQPAEPHAPAADPSCAAPAAAPRQGQAALSPAHP